MYFHDMYKFDAKVKVLRTNNGTEYLDSWFRTYLELNEIIHKTSCVYTSE